MLFNRGSTFVLNNTFEKADHKQLSNEEAQNENELLANLKVLIQEKFRYCSSWRKKLNNKESIIIETSIDSSDIKHQMDLTEEIFSELKIMNKQNGIIIYTVLFENKRWNNCK